MNAMGTPPQTEENIQNNYYKYVRNISETSEEQKQEWFKEYKNNTIAKTALVESLLPTVIKIAKSFKDDVRFDDLVQVGNIALLESIERYDPTFNTKISTFCYRHIHGEMSSYRYKNMKIIKPNLSPVARSIYRKLLTYDNITTNTINMVSHELGVNVEQVRSIVSLIENIDVPYEPINDDSDDEPYGNCEYSPDRYDNVYDAMKLVGLGLNCLHDDEKYIIQSKWLCGMTAKQIGNKIGLTAERICQKEAISLLKMKKAISWS